MIRKKWALAVLLLSGCTLINKAYIKNLSQVQFPRLETDEIELSQEAHTRKGVFSKSYNVKELKEKFGENCIVSQVFTAAGIELNREEQIYDSAPTTLIILKAHQATHEKVQHFLEEFKNK